MTHVVSDNSALVATVSLYREHYHLIDSMIAWCREVIGPGRWCYGTPTTWAGMYQHQWVVDGMFGNTKFSFRHAADATAFSLKWL